MHIHSLHVTQFDLVTFTPDCEFVIFTLHFRPLWTTWALDTGAKVRRTPIGATAAAAVSFFRSLDVAPAT